VTGLLDDRVRAVLARLEAEDAEERRLGLPSAVRSRQVAATTGRFLFALVAPQAGCEVLEIGGSRGYSTIWLAAGVRHLGGRVLSLEQDPRKVEAWRRNIAEAGLEEWAEKGDYEALFGLARGKLEPGALVAADNVLSDLETLGAYSAARRADPTLESITLPLDRGLELTIVLR
jgi:predicted O-methyltransferase YrrM